MDNIKILLLISGKRKSGKDYISEKLQFRIGERSQIIRISEPIKSEWARRLNINYMELLTDSSFKEEFRKDMIVWSDGIRQSDYGFFCKTAMQTACSEIIIVSDVRRKTDISFFKEIYGCRVRTIRIICTDVIRRQRGWKYTDGIDNVESECDLDNYENWDLIIENNENIKTEEVIDHIVKKFNLNHKISV